MFLEATRSTSVNPNVALPEGPAAGGVEFELSGYFELSLAEYGMHL
jgi:hypothetical protein